MKSFSGLFPKITCWANLLDAERKARLRKRDRDDVQKFHFDYESLLLHLQEQLTDEHYLPGSYRTFEIVEPKHRLISAAPYRDRVVHHAICNQIEPLLDRGFIDNSFACRRGKGQHQALVRARRYCRQTRYVLKTDFRRFFASIDHHVLLEKLQRKFREPRLNRLIEKIVVQPYPKQRMPLFFPGDDLFSHSKRRCGLPIGNLTSQLFGNFYLVSLDHMISQTVGVDGYIRYMDDLALFGNSKNNLWEAFNKIEAASAILRLRLHPRKTNLTKTGCGFRFLGYHVASKHCRILPEAVTRFRRRMRRFQTMYENGTLGLNDIRQSVMASWGHFKLARTPNRFRKILSDFPFFHDLVAMEKAKREKKR